MPSPPISRGDYHARSFAERERNSGIFKPDSSFRRLSATAPDEATRLFARNLRSPSLTFEASQGNFGGQSSASLSSVISSATVSRQRSSSKLSVSSASRSYMRETCSSRNRSRSTERAFATSGEEQFRRHTPRVYSSTSLASESSNPAVNITFESFEAQRQGRRLGASVGSRQRSNSASHNRVRKRPPVRPQHSNFGVVQIYSSNSRIPLPSPLGRASASCVRQPRVGGEECERGEGSGFFRSRVDGSFFGNSTGSDSGSQVRDPLACAATSFAEGCVAGRRLEHSPIEDLSTQRRSQQYVPSFSTRPTLPLDEERLSLPATHPGSDSAQLSARSRPSLSSRAPSRATLPDRSETLTDGSANYQFKEKPRTTHDRGMGDGATALECEVGVKSSENGTSAQDSACMVPLCGHTVESLGSYGVSLQDKEYAERQARRSLNAEPNESGMSGSRRSSLSCSGLESSFTKSREALRGAVSIVRWLWCWLVWMVKLLNTSYDSWAAGTAEIWVARPWAVNQKDDANRQCKQRMIGTGLDAPNPEGGVSLKAQSQSANFGAGAIRNRQQAQLLAARVAAHTEANASRVGIRSRKLVSGCGVAEKSKALNKDHHLQKASGCRMLTAFLVGVFAVITLAFIRWNCRNEDEFVDVEIM